MIIRSLATGFLALSTTITWQAPSSRSSAVLYASVADASGGSIVNLTASDFVFDVDGKPQAMTTTFERDPGTFILLLDRSGSMTAMLDAMAFMSTGFATELPPASRLLIAPISQQVVWHVPDPVPENRDLTDAVRKMPGRGDTPLWDTVDGALRVLNGLSGYRAVVIVSDGEDTRSRLQPSDVTRYAQTTGVVIHAIFMPLQMVGLQPPSGDSLRHVTEESGGVFWRHVKNGQPRAEGARLGLFLSGRYAIRFAPPTDGKAHEIRLRVPANPTLKVAIAKRLTASK